MRGSNFDNGDGGQLMLMLEVLLLVLILVLIWVVLLMVIVVARQNPRGVRWRLFIICVWFFGVAT
jgi:hypothetical protein